MPNTAYWTASMLLRWIMTRSRSDVLAMLRDCGGHRIDIESEEVTLLRLPTWVEELTRAALDPSLPLEEQKAEIRARGVCPPEVRARGRDIIAPAMRKFYDALERGELTAQARRNGSGDIETIDPAQWRGLRMRSHGGKDVAVPADANKDELRRPHPLDDYLSGVAPSRATPTVWVEPEFPSEQVMRLWPVASEAAGMDGEAPARSLAAEGLAAHHAEHEAALPAEPDRPPPTREEAIRAALARGDRPGHNIPWGQFIEALMQTCRATEKTRGYGQKQISRLVEKALECQ
jgi:hypothetical protein